VLAPLAPPLDLLLEQNVLILIDVMAKSLSRTGSFVDRE